MTQKVQIGKSNLYVNPVALGANAIGGHNLYPNLNEDQNKDLLRFALDSGIDFIDTAFRYGNGRSEELIGEVLKEYPREEIVLATKASHFKNEDGETVHRNDPEFLRAAVDQALERLQTDYIDLFYIHKPDGKTPPREAVAALAELKEAGKIRAIGVSNFSLEELKEANADGEVDAVQDEFNLISRQNETELMPYCARHQIRFIPFFPLASGLLTGKYSRQDAPEFKEGDLRTEQAHFQGEAFQEITQAVDQLRPIADRHGIDIVHVVLNWYFSRPALDIIIPGAKTKEQVSSNLQTLDFKLTADEIDYIDQLFSAE